MSGQPGAPPAALAGGAAHAQLGGHSAMPLQLGPPPGRAEDAIIVSGFTEQQLATLKRQIVEYRSMKSAAAGAAQEAGSSAHALPGGGVQAARPVAAPVAAAPQAAPVYGLPRAAPAPAPAAAQAATAVQPNVTPAPEVLPRWALRRPQGPLWREAPLGLGSEQLGFDPHRLALEEAARQIARRSAVRSAIVETALAAPAPRELSDCTSAEDEAEVAAATVARTRLLIEQRMLRLSAKQAELRAAIVAEQKVINGMSERTYRKNVRVFDKLRVEAARDAVRRKSADHDAHLKRVAARRRRMQEEGWANKLRTDARNKGILRAHERMRREAARTSVDALARRKAHEAMMAQDYAAYLQHVKADGASERYEELANFLTKTESYLTTLGGKIAKLKATHERQDAAAAAAAAAKARGASGEEQAAAAVAAERAAMMAMDEAPEAANAAAYYTLAHAVGETITRQPEMLRLGQLREYQMVGLQWMISLYNNRLNGILADEMGLGKTVQVMALIAYLWENKGNRGPHLIIVPNAVIVNWRSEMRAWLPSVNAVFYVGHREAREKLFLSDVAPLTFNVLVTTYEFIMKDRSKLCKIKWRYLIIDEAQRMKDRESKLSRDLDYFECQNRLLLTGTPLQNDISELWALLNLLLPHVFDSYSAFQSWFSTDGEDKAADEWLMKEKRVIVISRLHQILEPFMLRRRIEDVESKLPPKVTHVVYAPMPAFQGAAYEWVKATGTLRLDPEYLVGAVARAGRRAYAPLQNKAMELRKMVNHPCLSYPPERGGNFDGDLLVRSCGKLWLLDRMLVKLHASGHRVLLFSTMTKLLDTLERYLEWRRLEGGYHMKHCRIDGTTPLEDREKSISEFNAPGSDLFIFLLSIRAAGRGLNLQSADTVVVYDPDPNPKNEEQAVARAHRIGQKREVRVFHFEAVADAVTEDAAAAEDDDAEDEEDAGAAEPGAAPGGDATMVDVQAPARGPAVDYTGGYRRRQRRATVGSVESLVRNTIQAQKIEMADEVINAGRFDQRTTHQERRATLEELVRDNSREGPAAHVVPRLHDLNAMMARTPEELRLFNAMDRDTNIFWPTWQTDPAELPHWLSYAPREMVAAQAFVAKPKPGRAGELAAAAAVAADLAAQGTELGRGVRGAANREVQQARNMAVRLYEQGRLDLDELDGSDAVAAAAEAANQADALLAQPEAPPPAPKAFSFKLKLSALPTPPVDAPSAFHAAAASAQALAADDEVDVVLAPEVREDEEEGIEAPDPEDNRHDSASEGGAPDEDDSTLRRPPFDEEDSERASAGAALRDATDAEADGEDDEEDKESPSAKRARLTGLQPDT